MFKRKKLTSAVIAATAAAAPVAWAEIEEVVVTATKRESSIQDIPVAVSALDQQTMDELGIANFQDYLVQMPSITAGGSGPGQNTIYIRGLASTTPNLTTAGVAGLSPNVAFYLDEQPLAQPGRNLDVYIADMARVEVLSGPQGTLFGASSQAGTVRLITNKPDPTDTYARLKLGSSFTRGGEPSNNVQGMVNFPVNDRLTLRGVVYVDNQGGYIDNVAGTRDVRESARFRAAGTVRANGEPVSAQRAGFQAGADLSGVTFLQADNANRDDEDINDTTYAGGRLSARLDISDDWSLVVAHARQPIESDGVFFADPDLGEYEIERFEGDSLEDDFSNTAWTFEGRVAMLDVVYTGAYTDREADQRVDYSDYLFVGQYLPYYICDYSVVYPQYVGLGAPAGTCQAPNLFVNSRTDTEVMTHEFRINTPAEYPIRATVGFFYSDLELRERNDFVYPGASATLGADGVSLGFADNFPYSTGYVSAPGPFPENVIFRNDVKRTDEQLGVFGEVTWDFTEQWALTVGLRYYDIEVDLEGSANSSFFNRLSGFGGFSKGNVDCQRAGTDISDLYNGDGVRNLRDACGEANQTIAPFTAAPDAAETDGIITKVSLAWTPTDNLLFYGTYSEGFRPGLLNRPGGATGPNNFTVPFVLDTDEVTNYELGWKLDLFDRTLRVNGSAFYVQVDDLQTTIFDPSIVNLFFSDNAADAEIMGVEGDFIWMPPAVEGLTVRGAVSILDTEITKVLTPTDDVRKGDELAYAPDFQFTLSVRKEWYLDNGLSFHVMPNVAFSSESQSDIITINRDEVDSWTLVGVTLGLSSERWTAELFVDNLFDAQAELARSFVFDRARVTYARPLNGGVRVSFDL